MTRYIRLTAQYSSLVSGRPYRVGVSVTNHAGSESTMWSRPVFVDTSPAVQGHVKDGWDWKTTALYQPYTDRVRNS